MYTTQLLLALLSAAASARASVILAGRQSDTITNGTSTNSTASVFMPALNCGGIDNADSCDGGGQYCCADPSMCATDPDDGSVWGCMNGNMMMCGTGTTMCSGARGATCCQDYESCDVNTGVCNPSPDMIIASMSFSSYVASSASSASLAAQTAAQSGTSNTGNAGSANSSPEMTLAAVVVTTLLRVLL